jgi:NADH:ubiquinone oxidoreductase subunit 5 (subunit L)/multisubunit Na+/H+ antiporter MnhA subunit
VPALLIVPFMTLALALSSVRTRRSASATALFGTVVMLLLTLLVAWGLTKKSPYIATYQYVNLSVAFQGPSNFQNFAIDLVLHVDHLTVVALVAIEICVFVALGWHQLMGRSEPGAARFHALVVALLFAAAGTLMSWDLAELFGFWLLGGAITYLLLAHRWGLAEPAFRGRIALALPFFSDACLFSGIAWLYARYGTQELNTLIPILHTNPGWTLRSLIVGAVLLFIGVGGRLGLWPFSAWSTQTVTTAPPAASAIVQAIWSVAGIVVLYRLTPIFVATNARTLQVLLAACAVAAIVAAVFGLLGNEPRRSITLAGSAAVAIAAAVVVNGAYHSPATYGIAGVVAVLAIAPARAGALLAIATIASAMRTDDLLEMGDGWRRMRSSSGALLASAVDAAQSLASLSPAAFALTKSQARQPVLDQMQKYARGFDAAVDEIWFAPESASRIRDYVSKTFKKI